MSLCGGCVSSSLSFYTNGVWSEREWESFELCIIVYLPRLCISMCCVCGTFFSFVVFSSLVFVFIGSFAASLFHSAECCFTCIRTHSALLHTHTGFVAQTCSYACALVHSASNCLCTHHRLHQISNDSIFDEWRTTVSQPLEHYRRSTHFEQNYRILFFFSSFYNSRNVLSPQNGRIYQKN